MLSRLLSVQRPVALTYVRSLRRRDPDATPEELIKIIRRHYLTLTTSGGVCDRVQLLEPGLSVEFEAQLLGDGGAGAIGCNHVLCADDVFLLRLPILNAGRYGVGGLLYMNELLRVPHVGSEFFKSDGASGS